VIVNIFLSSMRRGQPIIFPDSNNVPDFLMKDDLGLWLYKNSDHMPTEMNDALNEQNPGWEGLGHGEELLGRKCLIWDANLGDFPDIMRCIAYSQDHRTRCRNR
jgi:hypothetical protein